MNLQPLSAALARHFQIEQLIIAVVLFVFALDGCASSTVVVSTPTPPQPTATPTLTTITAEPGWHTTVPLGYVGPGVVTSGTQFVAHTPWQVALTCEGKGDLTITDTISTTPTATTNTQVYHCTATPQGYSVMNLYPEVGKTVSVNVSADPNVVWQGILEEQQ
ncbi:MAG: hypothetical protein ACRDHP_13740 [Ktedonobacterales bacterium]